MSSQQLADILLAQWQLLWWAKPADRIRIIEETRLDMEFSEQMYSVYVEFPCVISTSPLSSQSLEAF